MNTLKRILPCLLALLSLTSLPAQSYKGITPGSKTRDIRNALLHRGATDNDSLSTANIKVFNDRINNAPCTVFLPCSWTDRGYYLDVKLPLRNNWDDLINDFNLAVAFVRKEHGTPVASRHVNTIIASKYNNRAKDKFTDLLDGFLYYEDVWDCNNGSISVQLVPKADTTLARTIIYYERY